MTATFSRVDGSWRGRTSVGARQALPSRARNEARYTILSWLILAGAIFPTDIQLNLGGIKLTVGRITILLLLLPAVAALLSKERRRVAVDVAAVATGIWMVLVVLVSDGTNSIASAGAQSLEFLGGYLVARAYVFNPAALRQYIGVLKAVALIVVFAGFLDNLTGRLLVHETAASIFGTVPPQVGYRYGLARAASTFDHAILYGTFCSLMAAIFLYSQPKAGSRIFWVGVCAIGCLSCLSSVAMMSISFVLATYTYDKLFRRIRARWKLFLAMIAGMIAFLFVFSNNPIGWVISHLTLDPETGYFRILIWDAAMIVISGDPWTGVGFRPYGIGLLDATVDCVWLEQAMRFGLPMIAMLFLTNILAVLPTPPKRIRTSDDVMMARTRTGFTIALSMFMFTGLTVHFWNYLWIFWGVCIGVRASLREWELHGKN